jgi:hypothetical protein
MEVGAEPWPGGGKALDGWVPGGGGNGLPDAACAGALCPGGGGNWAAAWDNPAPTRTHATAKIRPRGKRYGIIASAPSPTPLGDGNQYQVQDSGDRAA